MSHRSTVLVIDDDPMVLRLVEVRLKDLNINIIGCQSGAEGIETACRQSPDLILLDVSMPEMDGFTVCRELRNNPLTRETPVIFLTGSDRSDEKAKGFELGAADYVTKPFEPVELRARVRAALRTQALLVALETQADTDSLTGLPNRTAFHRSMGRAIEQARRDHNLRFGVIFLDLDGFKVINDGLGHQIGDQLLVAVARRLKLVLAKRSRNKSVRDPDIVARMGGDEFTILLHQVRDVAELTELAETIRTELGKPLSLLSYEVNVNASLGIRLGDHQCQSSDELLRDSDTAMYKAKNGGKNQVVVFDKAMHEEAVERLELEHDLRIAIEEGQLSLHFQPIVDLRTAQLTAFESLLRWKHPQHGMIPPDRFIRVTEETGLIVPIGRWVIETACKQLAEWRNKYEAYKDISITVNISRVQMRVPTLVKEITEILKQNSLPANSLMLEVTEGAIMEDSSLVIPVMEDLRTLGVRLAMDDFGTGYSSLSSLYRFPLDVMKIDKEFIHIMTQTRAHAAVVNTIIALADNLELEVVAEGLESLDQVVQLLAMDCTYGQGFFLGRPMSAEAVDTMLARRRTYEGFLSNSSTLSAAG